MLTSLSLMNWCTDSDTPGRSHYKHGIMPVWWHILRVRLQSHSSSSWSPTLCRLCTSPLYLIHLYETSFVVNDQYILFQGLLIQLIIIVSSDSYCLWLLHMPITLSFALEILSTSYAYLDDVILSQTIPDLSCQCKPPACPVFVFLRHCLLKPPTAPLHTHTHLLSTSTGTVQFWLSLKLTLLHNYRRFSSGPERAASAEGGGKEQTCRIGHLGWLAGHQGIWEACWLDLPWLAASIDTLPPVPSPHPWRNLSISIPLFHSFSTFHLQWHLLHIQ